MDLDPLSPAAPARIRVLLLPVGRIKRSRFLSFVQRLKPHQEIYLQDVSPDGRPNRTMFSPQAFPTGRIVYDLTTTVSPESYLKLSPFELFREPLAVIAIADSLELANDDSNQWKDSRNGTSSQAQNGNITRELTKDMRHVKDSFPKALVHQLLVFDFLGESGGSKSSHKEYMTVPPVERSKTTTMKTVMCDLSSLILAEMTTFARSVQALHSVESPSSPRAARWPSTSSTERGRPQTLYGQDLQPSKNGSGLHSDPSGTFSERNHRMSMPVQPTSGSDRFSTSAVHRPTSPSSKSDTPPISPLEETPESIGSPPRNPNTKFAARAGTASGGQEHSRDRVSIHGFGSGGVSERARNKGKGRVGIVIGSLYLQAGRWGDALRELVDSATIAKSNSDHLWHAKALENILVTLIMFAWAGMDFQIPQICYPIADKSSALSKSPAQTPSGSTPDVSTKSLGAPNRLVSLQNLAKLLPDLVNLILNLYTRAANFAGESLPQNAYSESVIRFSKLLTTIHICDGELNDNGIQHIVTQRPFVATARTERSRLSIGLSRPEIVSILFRAFPSSSLTNEELNVIDKIIILSGISSVLSTLRFRRKMALVMRELVNSLIPGLVQARKVGAAELGIHPAAGIAALNALSGTQGGVGAFDLGEGDVESGVQELLTSLGWVHGVSGYTGRRTVDRSFQETKADSETKDGRRHHQQESRELNDSNDAVLSRIMQDNTSRSYGSHVLKTNVLRSSINLCEALPDFAGVLRFTTDLLRTAGNGIAPKSDGSDVIIRLEAEEQRRLATTISRTVSAATKLGLQDIQTEYWDEFLVRGVEVLDGPLWSRPMPHLPKELEEASAIEHKEKTPFIYNPFLKKVESKLVEKYLVAGEPTEFKVSVQNPYDFEIEIEQIRLESEGVAMESLQKDIVVGPYRTQVIYVSGLPTGEGSLSITGCIAKMRGCRIRRFPIFVESWSPEREVKIKTIGLSSLEKRPYRPVSTASGASKDRDLMRSVPKPFTFSLTVIPEQPIITIKSTTLSQSALMVLEGEMTSFFVTLENQSETTPADLFLFSFLDSTMAPTQAAMSRKDISPADLYELELLFSRKAAFRWKRSANDTPYIAPGCTATFEVEVLGKPGLTSGTVQIDYTYLGKSQEELNEKFYTRQIVLPINVTVNASIELLRTDILPLACDLPSLYQKAGSDSNFFDSILKGLGLLDSAQELCLILLDLRNAWPSPLTITMNTQRRFDSKSSRPASRSDPRDDEHTEVLQPGQVSRLLLPLPRIALANPYAPIPTLNPANERQYVVTSSKISPEMEKASREAFWLREEILKTLKGSWEEESTGRNGDLDVRNIRLSTRMIDTIKLEEVAIEISVQEPDAYEIDQVNTTTRSSFHVSTEEFFTLKTRVLNRSTLPIHPILRLQPSLRNQSHNFALDISKSVAWNGLLQRRLPLIRPGEVAESTIDFCILSRGEFEIGATVEEIQPLNSLEGQDFIGNVDGLDLSTIAVMKADKERKLWHLREGCIIIANDEINDR
ncbi:MAG: hypothetical protein M4579_005368 [Chaenotheca gracillima]|nr:MAG: hypothetical protein M4579_005368 [Chaenotheca gracillima]